MIFNNKKENSDGVMALYVIQALSTFSFAVLFSSLSLFLTDQLGIEGSKSNSIVGIFLALNYVLHLIGGVLGERFLSNRSVFFITTLVQCAGIFLLSLASMSFLYLGLTLFLIGCGINVTSYNNMLSNQFSANDKGRESAFFYSYAAMNVGFCSGFFISGFFDTSAHYENVFYLSIIFNIVCLLIMYRSWSSLKDPKSNDQNSKVSYYRKGFGLIIIGSLIPVIMASFSNASVSNFLVIFGSLVIFTVIFYLGATQKNVNDRKKVYTYLYLAVISIIFWMIYYTGPMGVTLFVKHNVDKSILHHIVPTQWILNINSLAVILLATILPAVINFLRARGYKLGVTTQFSWSFCFLTLSFVSLSAGVWYSNSLGYSSVMWVVIHFVLQAFAELLIGPVGLAMIAKLAPNGLQSLLMGAWMMVSGVSASLSHYFSNEMVKSNSTNPLISNPDYQAIFNLLGEWAVIGGVTLLLLSPKLKRILK